MNKLATLKLLQSRVDDLRRQLQISAPNEVIFLASLDPLTEEYIVVEADGFGGARLSVIEGLFPIDYLVRDGKEFRSEARAKAFAENLLNSDSLADNLTAEVS